ncbi:MAG: hypothetical protein KAT48_14185 [Bacteroidales bacterium]|nr:hypothetical protein [Bacteroidales bacterium]
MNTTYEIMVEIVGQPSNDIEQLVLYLCAACLAVMVFYFVLYLFKLIAGLISTSVGGGDKI